VTPDRVSRLLSRRRVLAVNACGLIALLPLCAAVAGCGGSARPAHSAPSVNSAPSGSPAPPTRSSRSAPAPFRFFSPQSFWNQPVSSSAPVDPASAAMVAGLSREVQQEQRTRTGPWINTGHDGIAIINAPANQPTVRVVLRASNGEPDPALSAAWSAVPLPAGAQPSTGDKDLAVWQPSTDRMWEFFGLTQTAGHWEARWGGAMRQVSTNPGVYGPGAWPGAQPYWGVTAASFPLVGGAMTVQQLQAGNIGHALAITIPSPRASVFAVPAERTDGSSQLPDALPEGARLRLDPNLDLNSLGLPPITRAIAEAAQRYGIIVRDTSGNIAFAAQDPLTEAATAQRDPYSGPKGLFEGQSPLSLLAKFPWERLEVLKLDVRTHSA
jgi:hypothetical protein